MQRGEQTRAAGAEDQDVGFQSAQAAALRQSSQAFTPSDRSTSARRACASLATCRTGLPPWLSIATSSGPKSRIAEVPQRFGIQIVEIDVLDAFDPGRFQRRSAADDREIGAAQLAECGECLSTHAALADDDAHAVRCHQTRVKRSMRADVVVPTHSGA